uniref:E3 SUMO-protein ligase ZBED1-like n=1 Tax=Centroberyx gerrardi TaxID=166262 RepID=UPI003AAD5237
MVSFNTVEKQSFRDLLTTLDRQYEVPGRTYFSTTAIPRAYTCVRKWTLVSKCLQTSFLPEDHTTANLADALQEALQEWGLEKDKVSCLTTDSGSNIKAAVRNLGWSWLSCFGHNLNLAVSNTVDKTEKVRTDRALAVCRTINGMFSHSWRRRRELQKAQVELGLPEHSLVADCATRWGSKQKMIERMLEQRQAINRVLTDDRKANVSITWQDEDVLQSVNKALKPVSEFTDILSGENYVTASSLLPVLHLIKEDTLAPSDEDRQLTADLKTGIISILDEKYEALPEASRDLMSKATFMDPRYRGDYDPNVEETKRMIEEEAVILGRAAHPVREEGDEEEEGAAAEPEPQPKRKKTLASLLKRKAGAATATPTLPEKVVTEIATYARESAINAEEDPLVWWKANQTRLPLLAKVAKKYLCVCATSCASERVFSTAGNVVTPTRSLLKPEKVNMLVFLAKNM